MSREKSKKWRGERDHLTTRYATAYRDGGTVISCAALRGAIAKGQEVHEAAGEQAGLEDAEQEAQGGDGGVGADAARRRGRR